MTDYAVASQSDETQRRIRALQRKKNRSLEEENYLKRVAGTSTRFQGLNQRQRRKRARQVGR